MERQGLCDPRLDRLGPASTVVGFLLAVATDKKRTGARISGRSQRSVVRDERDLWAFRR